MGTQTVTTDTLVEIEKRVLWLSTAIVDAANRRLDQLLERKGRGHFGKSRIDHQIAGAVRRAA